MVFEQGIVWGISGPHREEEGVVEVKAITLLEPWASLIAVGAKKIETRSWSTKYRGPLAIQAGKSLKAWHMDLAWKEPFFSALVSQHTETGGICYSRGCVIATCNLVDIIKMTPEFIDFVKLIKGYEYDFGNYTVGRYAWILENVKRLAEPVPAKGKLSLWEWEGERVDVD